MKPCYLIAEIGVNHNGNLDIAIEMVNNAKLAGANAVKFQTYNSSTLVADNSPVYWDQTKEPAKSQKELFKQHECTDISFYLPIIEECERIGIQFLTTCFDTELVSKFDKYLEFYKISSSDLTNRMLISRILKTKKPIIMSCGASSIKEIDNAVSFIKDTSINSKLSLLHCVLNYPCDPSNANISVIESLISRYKNDCEEFGYSCHVPMPEGIDCCLAAITKGATIIEKHFTTSRIKTGNDHYHAMTTEDMHSFRQQETKLIQILGNGEPNLEIQESARNNARRSIYALNDIKMGDIIDKDNLIALRPIKGIAAEDLDIIIGKKFNKNKKKGEPIYQEDIS